MNTIAMTTTSSILAEVLATPSSFEGIENPTESQLDEVGHTLGVVAITSPAGDRYNVVAAASKSEEEIADLPVVHGKLFIVPNTALSPSSYWGQKAFDDLVSDHVEAVAKTMNLRTHDLSQDRMVQVWAHDDKSENWSDHGHPIVRRFPSHLPAKWLVGLKEGDYLSIIVNNCKILLECRQQGFRYGRFGTFEQVLNKVNKDYVPQA